MFSGTSKRPRPPPPLSGIERDVFGAYAKLMAAVPGGPRGICVGSRALDGACFGPACRVVRAGCVYACQLHQAVHECGGEGRCDLARPDRECVSCPVSGRTWPLGLDCSAFVAGGLQRDDSVEADGDSCATADSCDDGDGGGGGGDGVCDGGLYLNATAHRDPPAVVADDVPDHSGYMASRESSGFAVYAGSGLDHFRLEAEAREILKAVASGHARRAVNAHKRPRLYAQFLMAVRRYAQRVQNGGAGIDWWTVLCLHGITYPDVARYTDIELTDSQAHELTKPALATWYQTRDFHPADQTYAFQYHCVVAFLYMRTGYTLSGVPILPVVVCAARAVPTPRDMSQMGFVERKITQHSQVFVDMCARVVERERSAGR